MPGIDNPSRAQILQRIQAALARPAANKISGARGPIFAPVNNLLERFQQECALTSTECIITANATASRQAIEQVLDSLPDGEVFVQDAPELREIANHWTLRQPVKWSSQGAPAEASEAALTLAEALVALTGSFVTSASCGGRGASIVPPCHIVLANAQQLLPDLETAFSQVVERGIAARNSFVGLITGSSRTADIEKILVLGAHGPRRLVIIVQTQGPSLPGN